MSSNMEYMSNYVNLQSKGINLMSKKWDPLVPVKKAKRLTPEQVYKGVLNSQRLIRYIDEVCVKISLSLTVYANYVNYYLECC